MQIDINSETMGMLIGGGGALVGIATWISKAMFPTKQDHQIVVDSVKDLRRDMEKGMLETRREANLDASAVTNMLRADFQAQLERDRAENTKRLDEITRGIGDIKNTLTHLDRKLIRLEARVGSNEDPDSEGDR
jgi:hypothetical protein